MQFNQQPQRNTGEIIRQIFLGKNILSRLILINTVVFLFIKFVGLIFFLFAIGPQDNQGTGLSVIGQFLALPSSLKEC